MTAAVMERTEVARPGVWLEAGLPGFPVAHGFVLERWGPEDSPFLLMRSTDVDGLQFVVVPPAVFFPDYHPEIDDATAERLGLRSAEDSTALVILTLGDRPEQTTANLLAPLVINTRTGRGAQVVLSSQGFDTRVSLVSR